MDVTLPPEEEGPRKNFRALRILGDECRVKPDKSEPITRKYPTMLPRGPETVSL